MSTNNEQRTYPRSHCEASIVYATYNGENYSGARMYNNSPGGMSFVSNQPLYPGSDICIKLEDYLKETSPIDGYRAEVIWCKEVADVYASYYGDYEIGVQYYDTLND